jgi:hypothetical protein
VVLVMVLVVVLVLVLGVVVGNVKGVGRHDPVSHSVGAMGAGKSLQLLSWAKH